MPSFEYQTRIEELISRYGSIFSENDRARKAFLSAFAERDDDLEDYLDAATSVSSIGVEETNGVLGHASFTNLVFDVQTFISGGGFTWDGSTAISASRAGIVLVTVNVQYIANGGTGTAITELRQNGGAIASADSGINVALGTRHSVAKHTVLDIGDFLQIACFQNTGGNEDVTGTLEVSFFSEDQ